MIKKNLLSDVSGGKACEGAEQGVYSNVNDALSAKRNAADGHISQQVWGFTPGEGEDGAIILYTLTNESGARVQVTNLGAALVSVFVPDRDGNEADVVAVSAPMLVNRVWESRVEGNRVVLSTVISPAGGELAVEIAYHWSDDNELEIICATSAPVAGFAPRTRFGLAAEDRCFEVEGWRKNILAFAGSVSDEATGRRLTVLTSLPGICVYGYGGAEFAVESAYMQGLRQSPNRSLLAVNEDSGDEHNAADARLQPQIQKIVYRFEVTA